MLHDVTGDAQMVNFNISVTSLPFSSPIISCDNHPVMHKLKGKFEHEIDHLEESFRGRPSHSMDCSSSP